jgi:outer membrane protein assembly factor BamB
MRSLSWHLVAFATLTLGMTALGAEWPGFRGPTLDGVSTERGLPVKWGPEENIVWKLKLPGAGSSSPVVWQDRVFLTCFSGYGVPGGEKAELADLRRHLLCIDRTTGKVLWQKDVPAKLPESPYSKQNGEHGYSTSTPVTDGERVYVFFGRTGVLAYDFAGKEVWQAELGKYLNNFGSAASPILHKNLLIVNATVESSAVVALDKLTGKEVWRTKVYGDCWSTPVPVEADGKTELVLNGLTELNGLDAEKGGILWKCSTPGSSYASSTPVVRNGIIYIMGAGFDGRWCMAVRPGGKDDVTNTHIVWKQLKAGASYCSPLLIGDRLYYFSGVAGCLKADTGAIIFQERLAALGTEYSSPVSADGKIYLFTRRKGVYVLAAKDKLELLAENNLGDGTDFVASPAISQGQLFVRSQQYLYCIGAKK